MLFTGQVILKEMHLHSKSEGVYAFLRTAEGIEYRLYRPQVYSINDSFFLPFENELVEVEGEPERDSFIAVESISLLQIEEGEEPQIIEEP